jgi:hypothetical protein
MMVEIYHGSQLQQTAVWCSRCIVDAEQRSQHGNPHASAPLPSSIPIASLSSDTDSEDTARTSIERLVQEHLQLMDRAMHEEDAVLVPLVEDFMLRCRAYHEKEPAAEYTQRLIGHLQYWDAFLRALQQSQ